MNKNELKEACLNLLQEKIQMLQTAIDEAQSASNQETKSTAGDKHDTAKAHAQNETERLGNQMAQMQQMFENCKRLSTEAHSKIQVGSFVQTNRGNFYISVALGKMNLEALDFFAISLQAPLGQLLIGKVAGDEFVMMNGQECVVQSIV